MKAKGYQSAIQINDANLSAGQQAKVSLRDGVKIDSETESPRKKEVNYECGRTGSQL